MTNVAKYNVCKGVSTLLTLGTPIATLACCGEMFVGRSDTAISAAGVFAILFTAIFAKDKLAENFKCPSALILSSAIFILLIMVEKIILPIKYVCIATMIASGVDEFTFKNIYKACELKLPESAKAYKHFGFLFVKNKTLEEGDSNGK